MCRSFIQRSARHRKNSSSSVERCSVLTTAVVPSYSSSRSLMMSPRSRKSLLIGRARVRSGVLDVRPVHIFSSEFKIGFNRLAGVAGAADNEPTNHDHLVPMQMVDGFKRRIPRFPPVLALAVLGLGSEEPQVFFKDVFDAEEDIAEAGCSH